MTHAPLLSQVCHKCGAPFSTVSHRARFCSDECRNLHWKENRKKAALIKVLAVVYDIGNDKCRILIAAVNKATAVFYRFAEWLGFTYSTKKYEWKLTV